MLMDLLGILNDYCLRTTTIFTCERARISIGFRGRTRMMTGRDRVHVWRYNIGSIEARGHPRCMSSCSIGDCYIRDRGSRAQATKDPIRIWRNLRIHLPVSTQNSTCKQLVNGESISSQYSPHRDTSTLAGTVVKTNEQSSQESDRCKKSKNAQKHKCRPSNIEKNESPTLKSLYATPNPDTDVG